MPRRKSSERNTRSIFSIAGGKSYAITLPLETLRAWNWDAGMELTLKPDDKRQRFVIEAKKP
jgi:hypothetical protein